MDDVWNLYNSQKFPDKKCDEFTKRGISKDEKKQMIYRKVPRMMKWFISENKSKHDVSLKISNETNKQTWGIFGIKKSEYIFETEQKKLPKQSEDGKFKYMKHTLNSVN